MATISLQGDFASTFTEVEDIIIGIYIVLVGSVSLFANIVVLRGILTKNTQMTDMDIITVSIAFCQVAPSLLSYPLVLLSAFSHGWYFSQNVCNLDGFFIFFFAMTTIGSLSLMTGYRFLRMFQPQFFSRRNTTRVKCMVIVGVVLSYAYGMAWALPPILGVGSYILEPHHLACSIDWESIPFYYVILILLFGYFTPVVLMTVSYGKIVYSVKSSVVNQGTGKARLSSRRRDFQVTAVSILHCGCFILVWTPYAIMSALAMFRVPFPDWLYVSSSLFAKVDTLVNPFMFFVISKWFVKRNTSGNGSTDKGVKLQLVKKKKVHIQKATNPHAEGENLLNPSTE